MSQPYVGEIRMFGGNFAPAGWAFCNGQLMPISENETLFNLIGTTYGGDGQNTFALPDLRGRIPLHQGSGYVLAQAAGEEQHILTTAELPAHVHPGFSSNTATSGSPINNLPGNNGNNLLYAAGGADAMNSAGYASVGGSQPHDNLMPFLCINFIISLFGIFPSQS